MDWPPHPRKLMLKSKETRFCFENCFAVAQVLSWPDAPLSSLRPPFFENEVNTYGFGNILDGKRKLYKAREKHDFTSQVAPPGMAELWLLAPGCWLLG